MHYKISGLDMMSFIKVFGALQAAAGLLTGFFFTVLSIIDPYFLETNVGGIAAAFGVWSVIFLPILNGVLGALSGALICILYNLLVEKTGLMLTVKLSRES